MARRAIWLASRDALQWSTTEIHSRVARVTSLVILSQIRLLRRRSWRDAGTSGDLNLRVQCCGAHVASLRASRIQVGTKHILTSEYTNRVLWFRLFCRIVEQEQHRISCHPVDGAPTKPKALQNFAEDLTHSTVYADTVSVTCSVSVTIIITCIY